MEENFELMQQMLDFKSRWGVQTMNDLFCQFDRAAEKFSKQLDEELGVGWKLSP